MGNDDCLNIHENNNINFFVERSGNCEKPKYSVTIKSNDECKALINEVEFFNVKELSHLILIINQIYHNCNIPKKDMKSFKDRLEFILTGQYFKEKGIDLNSLDDIRRNRFNINNIKNCFNIFKFIYNNKNKIPKDKIDYLLNDIEFLLNNTKILDEPSIKIFKHFLEKIYKKENNKALRIYNSEMNYEEIKKKKIIILTIF